jgi:UDPglucose--hexose-1-phosphate uridylyltransferase
MAEPPQPPEEPAYRSDPATGALTYVVASRQDRPNLPTAGCPFCPGGLEAPEPYLVRWFPNRWPVFPDGRCEVVLYTDDHDATFASLGVDGARRVVDLWAARTAALGARADVDYVLIFENRGPEVGATIAHPHGQIYAFDLVPPAALEELQRIGGEAGSGRAVGVDDEAGARLVARAGAWRAWVPWAATWPYAVVVAATEPWAALPQLDDGPRQDLAAILVDVLGRLDRLFDEPMPYMLWIHQAPTDGRHWPGARVRIHLAPVHRAPRTQRFVAAGELGSGIFFNPVDPADAAAALREA